MCEGFIKMSEEKSYWGEVKHIKKNRSRTFTFSQRDKNRSNHIINSLFRRIFNLLVKDLKPRKLSLDNIRDIMFSENKSVLKAAKEWSPPKKSKTKKLKFSRRSKYSTVRKKEK